MSEMTDKAFLDGMRYAAWKLRQYREANKGEWKHSGLKASGAVGSCIKIIDSAIKEIEGNQEGSGTR